MEKFECSLETWTQSATVMVMIALSGIITALAEWTTVTWLVMKYPVMRKGMLSGPQGPRCINADLLSTLIRVQFVGFAVLLSVQCPRLLPACTIGVCGYFYALRGIREL